MLHDHERKVRLTKEADDLLRAIAAMRDVPPAVLAREILVRELRRASFGVVSVANVAAGDAKGRAA